MHRSAALAFAGLCAFLLLLPLSLKKPGLPMQLHGDEATQYLMAASLAHDGDLACEAVDVARLFAEFPFAQDVRLELAGDASWQDVRFARPLPYPLLAAPFAALWGAGGLIAFNALLFLVAVACGWRWLRRWNDDGLALLGSCGFFAFSLAFPYLFRMEPQVLTLALVAASFSLAWNGEGTGVGAGRWQPVSGGLLALATWQEPALGLLGLPLLAGLVRSQRRLAGSWLTGFALTAGLVALLSTAWTGRAAPAAGGSPESAGLATFVLDSPLEIPWLAPDAEAPRTGEAAGETAGSEPTGERRSVLAFLEDAVFLLIGRRAGLLAYFPWLVPLGVLLVATGRWTVARSSLLVTLGAMALLQVALEPVADGVHQYQLGNPHAIGAYSAVIFLVTRITPSAVTAGYTLGAICLSTLLLTPFGGAVPGAPVHSHTRSFPFPRLPLEYPALPRAPGFFSLPLHGFDDPAGSEPLLWAPADQTDLFGDVLWLTGTESVELWLESRRELPPTVLSLRNLAPGNRIRLRHAGTTQERQLEDLPPEGITFQLALEPEASRIRRDSKGPIYFYRLAVSTRLGEKPKWRLEAATPDYLGVAIAVLGSREVLSRDLFHPEWIACAVPPQAHAGEELQAVVRLRNRSSHPWPNQGPARVRLSYHWRDANGERLALGGLRSELPERVEPGQDVTAWMAVQAPETPGRYQFEADALYENVAWFSRRAAATCRAEIEVGPR